MHHAYCRSGTFVMVLFLQLHIFLNRQTKIIAIFLRGHFVSICGNHWPIHQTECLSICAFCQITELLILTECTTLMLCINANMHITIIDIRVGCIGKYLIMVCKIKYCTIANENNIDYMDSSILKRNT